MSYGSLTRPRGCRAGVLLVEPREHLDLVIVGKEEEHECRSERQDDDACSRSFELPRSQLWSAVGSGDGVAATTRSGVKRLEAT